MGGRVPCAGAAPGMLSASSSVAGMLPVNQKRAERLRQAILKRAFEAGWFRRIPTTTRLAHYLMRSGERGMARRRSVIAPLRAQSAIRRCSPCCRCETASLGVPPGVQRIIVAACGHRSVAGIRLR